MDITKKIIFILVLMLLASNSGCFRHTDKLSNTETDNIVPVDGKIEYTAKPTLTQESKELFNDNVYTTPPLFNNEDVNSQTEQETESSDIIYTENESDVDVGIKNSENESNKEANTINSQNESNKVEEIRSSENESDKDVGIKSSQNESDEDADSKNDKSDQNAVLEKHGLVELIKLDDTFVIDIKYATEDNFAKKKIYTLPLCLINKNTAKKLIAANNEFKTLGYRIKVFDAYRPHSAQQVLWDAAEDKSYLANPKKGSKHNRGAAVDVTLVDGEGQELGMPSGYDEFSERAHLKFNKCDEELIKNRELLGEIMVKHGFKRISTEWWHFDDTDALKYPLLDSAFEEFVQ